MCWFEIELIVWQTCDVICPFPVFGWNNDAFMSKLGSKLTKCPEHEKLNRFRKQFDQHFRALYAAQYHF